MPAKNKRASNADVMDGLKGCGGHGAWGADVPYRHKETRCARRIKVSEPKSEAPKCSAQKRRFNVEYAVTAGPRFHNFAKGGSKRVICPAIWTIILTHFPGV